MAAAIRRGTESQLIRDTAAGLVRDLPPKDYAGEARTLHAFVRDRIRYLRDMAGTETLHTAQRVLLQGYGDCDDKAILLASLAQAIGMRARLVAVAVGGPRYSHVLPELKIGRAWVPAETTVKVALGWAPPNVVRRMVREV